LHQQIEAPQKVLSDTLGGRPAMIALAFSLERLTILSVLRAIFEMFFFMDWNWLRCVCFIFLVLCRRFAIRCRD